jgi:hypothetical protein
MPYIATTSTSDSRAIFHEFDPAITSDQFRQLAGAFPLTSDGRAAIPRKLSVGKPRRGGMPHIIGWLSGPWIVSPRVRDLIEELEPGVQEFSSIALIGIDGKSDFGTYFLILPPPKLDAVLTDRSELNSTGRFEFRARCVLDAAIIQGHHFWRGEGALRMTYFCSDDLRNRIVIEKLDGWDLRHRCIVESR